jgi:hypothetical protein
LEFNNFSRKGAKAQSLINAWCFVPAFESEEVDFSYFIIINYFLAPLRLGASRF